MEPFCPERLPELRIDWQRLIPLMGKANRALAGFNGIFYGLPHAHIFLSPLTTQEAVLSSRIEGTQATFGDVLQFEAGQEPDQEAQKHDIQEILNYRAALERAQQELAVRPFNLNLLLELHSILLDSVRGRNMGRGRLRTVQNWIGRSGSPMERAEFVPPEPGQVPRLMSEWERFYHSDYPDPLVQLAIVHAQFEIIHPFLDGNGRLGRIVIPLFLSEKGLLTEPVFYLSAYFEAHRDEYVDRLRHLTRTESGWNDWIAFFLQALEEQAHDNLAAARAINDLYARMKPRAIELTRSQFAVPLLDAIFAQPIFSAAALNGREGMPTKPVLNGMLTRLKEAGILEVRRESSGRRAQILAFPELLDLCEGNQRSRSSS